MGIETIPINEYAYPAEWEPHQATWLAYPHNARTFLDRLSAVQEAFIKLVYEIAQGEDVHITVNSSEVSDVLMHALKKSGVLLSRIHVHTVVTNDAWTRDHGAIILKHRTRQQRIASLWQFNSWGKKYPFDFDCQIGAYMAHTLDIPEYRIPFVFEGGSIEGNGHGCFITTESCLLNPNRNPNKSKDEIERVIKETLGGTEVLWLSGGLMGDDTDGHVDDVTRFVSPHTIVTCCEKNPNDPNYDVLKTNYERLEAYNQHRARPFTIVPLPMPSPVSYQGKRLPASYANFYICNHAVIVPTFQCEEDEEALRILKSVFPHRRIMGINSTDIIVGRGSFHCLTQQIPL